MWPSSRVEHLSSHLLEASECLMLVGKADLAQVYSYGSPGGKLMCLAYVNRDPLQILGI